MKVLVCIPSFAIGGAEKFAVDLAIHLKGQNCSVTIAETRNNVTSAFRKMIEEAGIEIVDLAGKTYFEMLRKQIRYFIRNRPDVIHTNVGSLLHIMVTSWLFCIKKKVYTIHNEAKLFYGNSVIRKFVYRMAFSFFGFVPVAISQSIKESMMQGFGFDKSKIPVVHNGVDIDRFVPGNAGELDGEIRIISVGTLYWIKNQEMIINAVCNLREKGERIKLELIGDGEDRTYLESLIAQKNAELYITLHGQKTEVEKYLQTAHIYVSASKTEGLPLSILEAMACGLPVVATNAGGTKDIVHDGVNGYIVDVDDASAFESALHELLVDEEKRKEFSLASRRIAEGWSMDLCAKGYIQLYEGF